MIKVIGFDLEGTIGDTMALCLGAFQKAMEPYLGRILTETEILSYAGLNERGMINAFGLESSDSEAVFQEFLRYYQQHGQLLLI